MALSFAVKCAFPAFACTAHRVCARSACLLQRTQQPAGGVARARPGPAAAGLLLDTTSHHNKDLPVSWYRDLRPRAFEIPQATEEIRMRLFRGVLAWNTALASSRQSALCVCVCVCACVCVFNFLARIWLSELHHTFPRYPTEREKAGTNHPRVATPPRRRWRALGN